MENNKKPLHSNKSKKVITNRPNLFYKRSLRSRKDNRNERRI